MEKDKRKMLQYQINSFIESVLRLAENNNNLDHFNIEISNHNGKLQTDYTLRDRKKAY